MKLIIWDKIALLLGIFSIAITALADGDISTTNQSPTTLTPQQFASDAAVGGIKEILLSEEALERSTNDDINSFAKHMVKDHSSANHKLMKIAEVNGWNFPPTNMFRADDPNWSSPLIIRPESLKGAQLLTCPITDVDKFTLSDGLSGRQTIATSHRHTV